MTLQAKRRAEGWQWYTMTVDYEKHQFFLREHADCIPIHGFPPDTPLVIEDPYGKPPGWYCSVEEGNLPWLGPFSEAEAKELAEGLHAGHDLFHYIGKDL